MLETIQASLAVAGVDAATVEASPRATIVPESLGAGHTPDLFAQLVGFEPGNLGRSHERLELRGTIGEGGMGIVRLATQRALGREVAVKTLKPDARSERATLKLLREAWVTGALEHPNIVPVYDIAFEEDGSPNIVLKKIEGDEWARFIDDADAVRERFGAEDLLEWNLQVLMQVCNAVRFAHSRGVLHRDLKPENVMIGSFGEVYLVDWGLAVALEDDGRGRLPLASEARAMAGTPLYMAPEMLGGGKSRLSERTDIYLLGALLYEIVVGHPPHSSGPEGAEELMKIVASIVISEPELPPTVPEELTRIIRRAMSANPEGRQEDAEQVRVALHAFLTHRDAARLAEIAGQRLVELEALLSEAAEETPRESIYKIFGECRFGFRQALDVWPENHSAGVGLDRAIEAMIGYELSRSEPQAAEALLAEMSAVPETLATAVELARRTREERDTELRKLSADLDPKAGGRGRGRLALTFGLILAIAPLAAAEIERRGLLPAYGYASHTRTMGGITIIVVAMGAWARRTVMRTALNRRLAAGTLIALSSQILVGLTGFATAVPYEHMLHESFLISAVVIAMLSVSVERRLAFSATSYTIAYVVVALIGLDYFFYVATVANLVLLVNMALLWTRLMATDDEAVE